mgnify:CR=1 FL=1
MEEILGTGGPAFSRRMVTFMLAETQDRAGLSPVFQVPAVANSHPALYLPRRP